MSSATPSAWPRYSLKSMLIATAIVAVLCAMVAAVKRSTPPSYDGPISDRLKWPESLIELLAQASEANIKCEPVRVYLVENISRDYFIRMSGSPESVALMVQEWGLRPSTQSEVAYFDERWPKDWEKVNKRNNLKCLSNAPNTQDSYIVVIDESWQIAHVFYHWRF